MKLKFSIKNPLSSEKGYKGYDPRIHGVRQTHLQMWMNCRELARLGVLEGWRSIFQGVPLVYGSLSHGALKQVYRAMRDKTPAPKTGSELVISEKEYRQELLETGPINTQVNDIIEESCAILQGVLPGYFRHWAKEDTKVKWQIVEDKFVVPFTMKDGTIISLTGTYDGGFEKKNGLWLFETKNKARWSQKIGSLLPLDLQLGIYLTALWRLRKARPVGACYNLMRRPGERRGKDETLKDYAARIQANVTRDPAHYFERVEMELTKAEQDEHAERTQRLVQEFYDWWKNEDHSKRDVMWNSGSCETKYGECHYLDICANGDHSCFRRRNHDPTK
jgi:hypothetical protein